MSPRRIGASLGPFPWERKPKRLRSCALADPKNVEFQHLPLESDRLDKPIGTSGLNTLLDYEDQYLRYGDLKSLPRSQDVFRKIEKDPILSLRLPRPDATAGKVLEHACCTFERLLSDNKPMTFKFGITHVLKAARMSEVEGTPFKPFKMQIVASSLSQILTAKAVAEDFGVEQCAKNGISLWSKADVTHPERDVFRICILGVKGDAPYLSKVAHFYRSYNTFAKRGDERGPPKGCCPYCLAGTSLCAAEEIATATPKWLPTVAVKLPWTREPAIIKHLMHDRGDPASFFKSDIWHVFHLGFGRSWISSVIQLLLPFLPCSNLDEKWDYLTDHYMQWCRANNKQSHVSRISAYLVSYGDATGAMGNWHKGALTTNLSQWLVDLLGSEGRDPDGLLVKCREATFRVNSLFSTLYKAGAFLGESECAHVAEQGLRFLAVYAELALRMYRANRQFLFPLYPKLHIWHHLILTVKQSGERNQSAINPAMYACQIDEDLIGKASRLSRRVNIRKVASRTLERYLAAAYAAFSKEGWLS
ncbi:unnamed protein product [Cladocopium goreaui]|uniref:Uncharacterized protein n=1 Tax=Cladocopium goreaui TaxID=2562237 RepID=A0A9P1GRB1_9DINO|nr:unnamed protein product [Cladocopium goreaui]